MGSLAAWLLDAKGPGCATFVSNRPVPSGRRQHRSDIGAAMVTKPAAQAVLGPRGGFCIGCQRTGPHPAVLRRLLQDIGVGGNFAALALRAPVHPGVLRQRLHMVRQRALAVTGPIGMGRRRRPMLTRVGPSCRPRALFPLPRAPVRAANRPHRATKSSNLRLRSSQLNGPDDETEPPTQNAPEHLGQTRPEALDNGSASGRL